MIVRISPRPSRDYPSGPRAISSLTVARQRGIYTRFPVFAERQRRAFRKTFQRAEKTWKKSNGSALLKSTCNSCERSPSPAVDDVQQNGQNNTQQNRGGERKIKCRVLAAIDDVARQASQRQMRAPHQEQYRSRDDHYYPEYDQQLTEICHIQIQRRPSALKNPKN